MKSPSRSSARTASVPVADGLPTLEQAAKRLAVFRGKSLPWLTPASLEAAKDLPEVHGPETYRKP